jgi:probable rRNA maturation factor
MKPEITIINDHEFELPQNIEEIINSCMRVIQQKKDISITISFVNNEEMILLNKSYRGYAQSTDVLSFEANEIDPETGRLIVGDIVICYPHVQQQSNSLNNTLFDEINLMVIHGFLHLSGFDHNDDKNKSTMWKFQNEILKMNNISLNQIPE